MSQSFTSNGQSSGVSASASVHPVNIQDWFPLGWTGWISSHFKGLSRVFQHHSSNASILRCSAFFTIQLLHPYMTTGKTKALTRWTFVSKVMSMLFNMLSRLIAFLQVLHFTLSDKLFSQRLPNYHKSFTDLECIIALFISLYSS